MHNLVTDFSVYIPVSSDIEVPGGIPLKPMAEKLPHFVTAVFLSL